MSSIIVNLQNYIDLSKERHRVHQKEALFWNKVNTYANISLIILTSIATVLSVLEGSIPFYIVPIFTGLATIISSLIGVFKPFDKRNVQEDSSKKFKVLSLKLVACKSMKDYNELRAEILETMMDEPFTREKKKRGNKNKQVGKDGQNEETLKLLDEQDGGTGNHDYQVKQKAKTSMVHEKSLDDDTKLWNLDPEMRKAAIIEEIKMKTFEYNLLQPHGGKMKEQTVQNLKHRETSDNQQEQLIETTEECQSQAGYSNSIPEKSKCHFDIGQERETDNTESELDEKNEDLEVPVAELNQSFSSSLPKEIIEEAVNCRRELYNIEEANVKPIDVMQLEFADNDNNASLLGDTNLQEDESSKYDQKVISHPLRAQVIEEILDNVNGPISCIEEPVDMPETPLSSPELSNQIGSLVVPSESDDVTIEIGATYPLPNVMRITIDIPQVAHVADCKDEEQERDVLKNQGEIEILEGRHKLEEDDIGDTKEKISLLHSPFKDE
ncbi:uncharacterized protein [Clytia hemisphaerica]|uniref:Uncharacterized protein n=1 Tax=Clytia hemisphaerica TaxID=252671 RepID=A0A7M5V9X0_9CNID